MKHFFSLNYQNTYGHQTCQGRDKPRGAPTHIFVWHFNGVVFWGHVTNKIHIITYRRTVDTKLRKVLTYCEKLPPLKLNGLLIWPTWGYITIWKINTSTLTRAMATKLGRVLSSKRFSTQNLSGHQFIVTFVLLVTVFGHTDKRRLSVFLLFLF